MKYLLIWFGSSILFAIFWWRLMDKINPRDKQ